MFFFFNDTATTEIYTLSLHDALPISWPPRTPTNDHGEYRVYGLAPGAYYVAAASERAASSGDREEQNRADEQGRELPVFGYSTTFYPDTLKLSEAVPLRIDYAREVGGLHIFLTALP